MYKFIFFLPVFFTILLFSCTSEKNKVSNANEDRVYLDEISGSYSGEFTAGVNSVATPGTAEVVIKNERQLQIHCSGGPIDTTFIVDAFAHGDSVLVCLTGEDFRREYGHEGHGYHMRDMMGNRTSEWMHHQEDDHNDGDEHYGGFDMDNHTFRYNFKMLDSNGLYYLKFKGMK